MTGKEALIQVSKSCSGLALEFGNLKIGKTDNEALQTLKEIVQKYDKYKRVFEILKDNAQISIKKCLWDGETIYYLVINQEYGDQIQFRLSKEEKGLLEELMKGETSI